jgi:diguanylate cyclase (GGDEF)-like protein
VLQGRIHAQQLRGMPLPSSTVIGLDLRNFKLVSDRFGSRVSDRIRRLIVARLRLCLRRNDLIARTGEDEFAIYLGDLEDTAVVIGLRGRIERILEAPFEVEGTPVKVDASIGLSVVEPVHGNAGVLVNAVEAALFAAKHYRA